MGVRPDFRTTPGDLAGTKGMSLTEEDKQWIAAQMERVETALLTAFYRLGKPGRNKLGQAS